MSSSNSLVDGRRRTPVNIITGFLGVGKSSAIVQLLHNKPAGERWAVLVNEFGEIGVDGSILAGHHGHDRKIVVKEIPGGCMCCTAGLSMQVALNQLLSRQEFDRLLIEPTGLGHPMEVAACLTGEYNRRAMRLEKIITLVDARQLSDERYANNPVFRQQIEIADIVVANKIDCYQDADYIRLQEYLSHVRQSAVETVTCEYGRFALDLLNGSSQFVNTKTVAVPDANTVARQETILPDFGYERSDNTSDDFRSVGWRFSPEIVFEREKILAFLLGLRCERVKAVVITADGVFAYNGSEDIVTEMELQDCAESRIELISQSAEEGWEARLLDCLNPASPTPQAVHGLGQQT